MKISPISIKKQEFNKSLRGYEKEEVHSYLEKLSEEFEELQLENERLKRDLDQANFRLSEFHKIEKNLQDTLLKTQESSTKAIESTKRQSSLMIKEAEIKASQILDKARESANEIRNALISVREEKDLIIARLKAIVSSQAHLLEIKVEDAGEEIPADQKIEEPEKVDINIDDIVNKLL